MAFDGFALEHVDVGEVTLRVRHGGVGPALLLIHGHPRTHMTWHRVAPILAERFTVVCPDLRGYGESTLPPTQPDHAQSSKRAMAQDFATLMTHLGHACFAVAGHDRGGLAAFRLAMDHGDRVARLVAMDSVPVIERLERTDATFAAAWWHWWFLTQDEKPAEPLISRDPDAWYRTPPPEELGEELHADLWAAFRNPDVVHGMCEDYRAGLTVDRRHDEEDRAAGRKVKGPIGIINAAQDDSDDYGDTVEIWRAWVDGDVTRRSVDAGHHTAEQAPEAVAAALEELLA